MNLRNIKMHYFLVVCAFLISSCASVSPDEIKNANFGEKPAAYEEEIKNLMSLVLKDPDSAKYKFGEPRKGMTQDGWAVGGKKHFGYIVPVIINAKNSFGGYVGGQQYYFLFSEGQVMEVTQMINTGMGTFLESQ